VREHTDSGQAARVSIGVRPGAWRQVRTPVWIVRGVARVVVAMLGLALLTSFTPWQQTAAGQGKVIAWAPEERQQLIEAPLAGRVERWFVGEGEHVTAGQVLARVADNDPLLLDRLRSERALVEDQLRAARVKVDAGIAKVSAAKALREASVGSAEAKVSATQGKLDAERSALTGALATAETARVQLARVEALAAEGLRSVTDVENARLRYDTAEAKRAEHAAKVVAAEQELESVREDLLKALADGDGKLAVAEGELASAYGAVAEYDVKLLGSDVKVARQANQDVVAPVDGVVAQITGGQGGELVKQGDVLAVLVPDRSVRSVELMIDGNDARFVQVGDEVRVQFEGWPALQVSGWPGAAVGTWGGQVALVDPVGDSKGRFRVVVQEEGAPWPDGSLLRLGLRVNGWVLLGQVPLGWEVWRQLNDFPPSDDDEGEEKSSGEPVERSKAGKAHRK
jgi:adhesin transport system membrane fusion protein